MEARRQTFHRLVSALDELVAQEAANLACNDYAGVGEIQRRAAPVVAALANLGSDVADAMARAKVASLLSRRQNNIDLIESQLATTRAEFAAVRARTARIPGHHDQPSRTGERKHQRRRQEPRT